MLSIKTVRPRVERLITHEDLALSDVRAVRLMLSGESIIDWPRLDFRDHSDVDRFLRLNEFDPHSRVELDRIEALRAEAVDYLTRVFQFSIPDDVAYTVPARDLFLMAARAGQYRHWACIVLKVMHICNHLAGREAMVRLPIADDVIFRATELKVIQVVEELRAAGCPIAEFEWSRKPRDSLITKLLAKRSTLAAKVYDKLRFRITVRTHEDLMPLLAMLMRHLIPFNYIIPGESINHLLTIDETRSRKTVPRGEVLKRYEPSDSRRININEFSGSDYRIINFVADLPLRLESLVPEHQHAAETTHVVFALAEFQLADKRTALANETGDSSHDSYKKRQLHKVEMRLRCGEQRADEDRADE